MRNLSVLLRLGAGILAAGALFGAGSARAMQFATVPLDETCGEASCRRVVIAEGEITTDAPDEFAHFLRDELRRPGLHAVVFLNSPGGNVESALKLGSLFHEAGAAVVIGRPVMLADPQPARKAARVGALGVVPGHCASACVYSLMGARRRVVPNGARVGVHRMSAKLWALSPSGGERIYAGQREINALRAYVSRVGGSQDLISLAESVPADQIRILSGAEVRKYRLGSPSL